MSEQALPLKIFVVEDDKIYSRILCHHLSRNPGYEVKPLFSGKELMEHLHEKPNVVTLDYALPDKKGFDLLKQIRSYDPDIQVVAISGQDDIRTAVELLKQGAYDYIVKDQDTHERLWNTISNIREKVALAHEVEALKEQLGHKYDFSKSITGNSDVIKRVFLMLDKAARSNITVSITGETGTGKELAAKAIHYNSDRAKKPFVAVNVAAIPKELIESELFGHEKGSFTGAMARRIGRFEEAGKGTLFLDEICELELSLQAKLLRVLQEKELNRIGGNELIKVEPRIIVSTHKNMLEEVKKGNFREDLYYRLLGLPVIMPPLRDRGNDILVIAKHFMDEFAVQNKMKKRTLSQEAQQKLLHYPYPGNVRELKAVIELAMVMADGDVLQPADISFSSTANMAGFLSQEKTMHEYTCDILQYFINKYNGNIMQVSRRLDIGKSTIYRMIQQGEVKAV